MKVKKNLFSLKKQAARSGMSPRAFLQRRLKGNLQLVIDSAVFDILIAVLIIVSVVLIFAEFFLPPGEKLDTIMFYSDMITYIFCVELSLRWVVAPSKTVFFKNYWIDILSVLPALGIFRSFRLLRLLRILRLTRAFIILLRRSGWLSSRSERSVGIFGVLLATTLLLITFWTLVIITLDSPPTEYSISVARFLDTMWSTAFLFISGEVLDDLPNSPWGRLVAVLTAVSGLLVFAVFVGAVSSLMTAYFKVRMDEKDLSLKDLRDHTIICGWDRLGGLILSELETVQDLWQRGVVVVAPSESNIFEESSLKNTKRLFHVKEDFTKMDVLERVGARYAKAALILSDRGNNLGDQDRDARTVLAALTLEKINPSIFTCAELLDEQNATHLRIAGVEEIISRTNLSAGLFASAVVNRGISTVLSDLLSHKDGTYLRKVRVPEHFIGKRYLEVFDYFKRQYDATVIAVDYVEEGNSFSEHHVNPDKDRIMEEDDELILIVKVDSEFKKLAL